MAVSKNEQGDKDAPEEVLDASVETSVAEPKKKVAKKKATKKSA
jgi:hypothetical protein